MSVIVHDGVLLGTVLSLETYKEINNKLGSLEAADRTVNEGLKEIVSEENFPSHENAGPAFFLNDNYNPDKASVYLGVFWQWGKRPAMQLDEHWQPLFQEMKETFQPIWDGRNSRIRQKLYDFLKNIIPNLKLEDIKMYEVRFWS